MDEERPPRPEHRSAEFRSTSGAAAALAVVALFEQLRGDGQSAGAALIFGALSAWTLISAFLNRRLSDQVGQRISHLNAFLCGLALVSTASLTGGRTSTYFGYAYALPMAFGVLLPKKPWMGVACALATAIAAIPMFIHFDDAASLATAELLILSSGFFSAFGTSVYRRLSLAEQASVEAREQALTALAQSERARSSQERFVTVGRLAAGVAHEINNPLAFVKANLEFIAEELPSGAGDLPELRTVLEETKVGVERIARIVADLKMLSRERTEVLEVLDVPALVDEAVRMASLRLHGVAQVEVLAAPPLTEVVGVPGRVLQVLLNLLVNASDALERREGLGRVRITCEQGGARYLLHFDDNGPGIPEGDRDRVFEPFFTSKPIGAGTGLGLAVSRSYLEQFGGSLSLTPSPLGGARFTVALAFRAPAEGRAPEAAVHRLISVGPEQPEMGLAG